MIDSLQKKLAFTDRKIESKNKEMQELYERLKINENEKLKASLALTIEKVEKSLTNLEQRVSTIEVRTNSVEKSISDVSKSVKSLNEKIT